jgi:GT2 family glycosyltransferase
MSDQIATKTLVIAVQYGRTDKTLSLVESISGAQDSNSVELVIVNNGFYDFPDSDHQLDRLAEDHRHVEVMNSLNLGYFGGANLGLKHFQPSEQSWVIVTNNDVRFDESFFKHLNSAEYPANCIVVPRILGSDGVDQNPQYTDPIPFIKRWVFAALFVAPASIGWRLFNLLAKLYGQRGLAGRPATFEKLSRVWIPLGAIFLIPASTMQKLRKLPDESFLYGEEMLLKRALAKFQGVFVMDPGLVVTHDESSTTGSLGGLTAWKFKRSAFFKYWRFYLFGF